MPIIAPENVRWRLQQIHNGRIFDVNTTDNFMVGRNQTAQIAISSNKTSRTHSSFFINFEGHLLVQDLKSVNGTFINGTRIIVYVSHRVYPGDTVSFGVSHMDVSENETDRLTFFLVIYDEPPPVQDLSSKDEKLTYSTSDSQENTGGNSMDDNQSSGKNTTAEVRNSHIEFSASAPEEEPADVIEIASTISDDEKPNLEDLDDIFLENIVITNVHSLADQLPERKKVDSNNWLQKVPSPKRPSNVTRSVNVQEIKSSAQENKLFTQKRVTHFAGSNRRHTVSEANDTHSSSLSKKGQDNSLPSTSKKNSCNNKSDEKNDPKNTENKKLQHQSTKKEVNISQEKKVVETLEKTNNQQTKESIEIKEKNLKVNSRRYSVNDLRSHQNSHNLHENHIQKHIRKAKETGSISLTGLPLLDLKKKDDENSNEKNNIVSKQASISKNPSFIQKDITKQVKDRSPDEKGKASDIHSLTESENKEKCKHPAAVSSRTPSVTALDSSEKKIEDGRFLKPTSSRKNADDNLHDQKKEFNNNNSESVEASSAEKVFSKRKSGTFENANNNEENKDTSVRVSLRRKSSASALDSDYDNGKKEKNRKPNDRNLPKKQNDVNDDLLLLLDSAISGKDDSLQKNITKNNEKTRETEKLKPVDKDNKNNNKKKKESGEEVQLKALPSHAPKKVIIDNSDEFILNSHCGSPTNEQLNIQTKGITTETNGVCIEKNDKNRNLYAKDLECKCHEPNTSNYSIKCPVHDMNSDNRGPSGENSNESIGENYPSFKRPNISPKNNKSLEKSFTTEKDNSVIIDITDDDDNDMDVSCSQIFHMSEKVKLETPDDTYQKIKNELAEMEFCDVETVINEVPINLETDMSGFENTQDICACLEDGIEKNQNNDNFISNEENEELMKTLEEIDKSTNIQDNNSNVDDMEVSFDGESSVLSTKNQNNPGTSKEETYKSFDCTTFFGNAKYVKPPVIEPHTIVNSKKFSRISLEKQNTNINKEESNSSKRKNSLETPTTTKKLKGSPSPRSVAEPPRCDSKSIQMEFKKRNSSSKVEQQNSKVDKESIREERRKKLKEITERNTPTKTTESKCDKVKTVKVLPESKTNRGCFLSEPVEKNNDNVKSKKRSMNQNNDIRKETEGEYSEKSCDKNQKDSVCKCSKPGTSNQRTECPTHGIPSGSAVRRESNDGGIKKPYTRPRTPIKNLDEYFEKSCDKNQKDLGCKYNKPGTSNQRIESPTYIIPSGRNVRRESNDGSCKESNARPKTPNKNLLKYHLEPLDLLESPSSRYNLRRTRSSGDIKADLAKSNNQRQCAQGRYNLRRSTILDTNESTVTQGQLHNYVEDVIRQSSSKVDPRTSRHALLPHPYANQRQQQYICPPQNNHVNKMETIPYNLTSRGLQVSLTRLMWTNGGPSNSRRAPIRRLPAVDDVILKMINWLPNWLLEQVNIESSAPVNNPPATKIALNFENFEQYYDTFSRLVLLETWQYLFKGFREGIE